MASSSKEPGAEQLRMDAQRETSDPDGLWRKWGPYLSEREWGTVREDYSADGDAWNYFPHDQARSRAYRWGEDGLAGYSDHRQRICLGLALWNGRDPILKERLFGLTNSEGSHGEDVKELYYYLDATPSHSWLRMLYKYPQQAYPYDELVEKNQNRNRDEGEYELLDTGLFDGNRYFDVVVEYAKISPEAVAMAITVHNRGPEEAPIHVLPQLWFRNTWSWEENAPRPVMEPSGKGWLQLRHEELGEFEFHVDGAEEWLLTENETRPDLFPGSESELLSRGQSRAGAYKDAFHDLVVQGNRDGLDGVSTGTKAAVHFTRQVPAGGSLRIRAILRPAGEGGDPVPFGSFEEVMDQRLAEADAYFENLQEGMDDPDARSVQRQALAGMIWSKQFYQYDLQRWLEGDPGQPEPPEARRHGRNAEWIHLENAEIISMPDKWEYPWYAAWDLAFHAVTFALVDPQFAKRQLLLMTQEWYMHPNGQLPAYEWAFGDVNPPVHAWATWRVYQMDQERSGSGDRDFLERVFHKLMLNFTWWVNRKDAQGRNIFQGGFLGLDNIGVFDRSKPLPTGGVINQADGTSWMAMYALNLMRIALELALENPVYEDIAAKFFEHFTRIAQAMNNIGESGIGLWDEEDGFYYDELNLPDGSMVTLRVRSMVGLIPLFAVEVLDSELLSRLPCFTARLRKFLDQHPELAKLVSRWDECGSGEMHLLSLLRGHRMKCLLRRLLDETEFLSDHGVRALSKYHQDHPYVFPCGDLNLGVGYQPGESDSDLFGGNSNWRGPIWMPVNFLLVESLRRFHSYYGDDFLIACPTGSGTMVTIREAAEELARRLRSLFLRDGAGHRAIYNHSIKLQEDPHFRDHVLFYEYFHGDSGRGIGSSHQTGWTGLVANLLMPENADSPPATDAQQRPGFQRTQRGGFAGDEKDLG